MMAGGHGRFHCPSFSLSLRGLLRRSQRILWPGLALALIAHLVLTQLRGGSESQKAIKPLTTQFVKRAPRLTKPLEMKKRPLPKRRRIQRQMVSVKAKLSRGQATTVIGPAQSLGGLARPHADLSRVVDFKGYVLEPQTVAAAVEGAREPSGKVDMALEMMDIEP